MKRRRRRWGTYREHYNEILLAEFKFYNKSKKVISDSVLKTMEERLKTGKEHKIYWTNQEFAKNGIGFLFRTITREEDVADIYITILEFDNTKFTADAFNKCKHILKKKLFIGFELEGWQSDLLYDLVTNSGETTENIKEIIEPIMTWDVLVDFMIVNRFLSRYRTESEWDSYVKDMKTLFGDTAFQDYETDPLSKKLKTPKYSVVSHGYGDGGSFHILSVVEKRIDDTNYRIALCSIPNDYNPDYTIKIFDDKSDDYVYIDQNRLFFGVEQHNYFLDDDTKEYDREGLLINKDIIRQMKRNIQELLPRGEKVIPPNIYRFYRDRVVRFERDKDDYGDDPKEERLIVQYKKLIEAGRHITLHNTIISKDKIEVMGERFKIEFDSTFLDVVGKFGSIRKLLKDNDVRYNFNDLYEKLLRLSILKWVRIEHTRDNEYKSFETTSFKVNDMPIMVHKQGNRMKINNVFSRINDVYHILTKVICYEDENEFNRYVKEVSYIGIEWKQMISNGLALELSNPFYGIFKKTGDTGFEKMYLRFSLLWNADKRNQVFLMLNNTKYLIKYKGKFKQYFNLPHRVLSMSQLKKELSNCVENLTDDVVIEIVENAVEEAKIIKQRGEELVASTIKEINAEEIELEIQGATVKGFKLKGIKTGNQYFIQKVNLSVFRYDEGKWNRRCIVNDHRKQRIFEDKLANRLINIYNEPDYLIRYLGDN